LPNLLEDWGHHGACFQRGPYIEYKRLVTANLRQDIGCKIFKKLLDLKIQDDGRPPTWK